MLRPLPGGYVFPGFNQTYVVNPGALPMESASAVEALYQPTLFGSTTHEYAVSAAKTSSAWGLGAGVSGAKSESASSTDTLSPRFAHAGAGLRFSGVGVGAAYNYRIGADEYAATGSAAQVSGNAALANGSSLDVGMVIGSGRDRNFALLLRNLDSAPFIVVGAGYAEKKYNLEADLVLPSFAQGLASDGSSYALLLSASTYAGIWGLQFYARFTHTLGTSATTGSESAGFLPAVLHNPLTLDHGVSALVRLGKAIHLSMRTDFSDRAIFGLQYVFK